MIQRSKKLKEKRCGDAGTVKLTLSAVASSSTI